MNGNSNLWLALTNHGRSTDIPEQRDWKKPLPDDPRLTPDERRDYANTIGKMTARDYWAQRARGMGGLYTTGAVENF
ncbi:hypothetical protein [Rhizobium sophoriradicis]|uniref:hypothetical protein n=1 Tax=Rhizobium sophoriradicis TaxID=1535245 RepID=UPI0015CA6826|nr:hypothetical protein [Rhizobium sophoriradicis]